MSAATVGTRKFPLRRFPVGLAQLIRLVALYASQKKPAV
jgi:hypothetical protein